jgi:hypothetical protein
MTVRPPYVPPSPVRRWLMALLPLALLGALVAGFALAPRPAGSNSSRTRSIGLLPPSRRTAAVAPARPAPPLQTRRSHGPARASAAQRARSHAGNRPLPKGPVSERPPAPASASAEAMMLAVARQFAVGYMPYQVGRLPGWVRTEFLRTCTPAFGRYLLAQPARPTALEAARPKAIETYRVAGVQPAGAPDTVAVSYVSEQDSADTGELLLRLVREHGRWLVASLEA